VDGNRVLRHALIVSDRAVDSGFDHYRFRAGIARNGRVDHFGTFDGAKHSLSQDEPWVLVENGTETMAVGDSVILDVDVYGRPGDLSGVTAVFGIGHGIRSPGVGRLEPGVRMAVGELLDYLEAIDAGTEWVSLALPRRVDQPQAAQFGYEYDTTPTVVSSGTFVNGLVSVGVGGSTSRPTFAFVTAEATFQAQDPNDSLEIAVGDGTTDAPAHSAAQVTVGSTAYVSSTRAVQENQQATFTLRYRTLSGTPNVVSQSISVLGVDG